MRARFDYIVLDTPALLETADSRIIAHTADAVLLVVRPSIERLGLQERVAFAGLLSDEQLAEYYRGAKMLLMPSLLEGFGLPIVEAMACGTPVVCANAASLPEIVEGAAWLVDPLSVADIARGISRVLRDDDLRNSLRQRGLERAQHFDWDKTAATVWSVLQAAAASETR